MNQGRLRGMIRSAGLALCMLAASSPAWALFELQVSPRRGGQHLRFEESRPGAPVRNEEVTIEVSSDIATQYRILQTVYQPLTSETGQTLPPGSLIVFSPSNPLGTLRPQLETPVSLGQFNLYTSNAAGDADSFVLVFYVNIPEDQQGGIYRTQIIFTAEPVTPVSGVTQRVVTMHVELQVRPTFRMDIRSRSGGRDLNLGRVTKDRMAAEAVLEIAVDSNLGTSYRIIQQLSEPMTSAEGRMLDESALVLASAQAQSGQLRVGDGAGKPVVLNPEVLYLSGDAGGPDLLQLQYVFAPGAADKAGNYRGSLSFRVESDSPLVPSGSVTVPVAAEIETIFDLDVEFSQGIGLQFGKLGAAGGQEEKRSVLLTVKSNLGEPYNVSQVVARKLTNELGAAIPQDNFVYQVRAIDSPETLPQGPQPVREGESVLYTSDRKGTPEKLAVDYQLSIPPGSKSGSYTSEIKYSLTTL